VGNIRFDKILLDYRELRKQADGSVVVPGQFARTGLQTYHNEDGSERVEYRSPDEVKASAPSFEGKAITDMHPSGMVDAGNWQTLARGHLQNVVYVDGGAEESWLKGDFHFKSKALIDLVERGERPELSGGYFCDEIEEPGEYQGTPYHCVQRGIVGNHVASIPAGTARAGRDARLLLDSDGNQVPPGRDTRKDGENMNEYEIKINGVPFRFTSDQAAKAALEQALEAGPRARTDAETAVRVADAKVQAAEAARDEALGKIATLEQKHTELKAELADSRDPAKLDARAAARAELIGQALRLGVKRDALKRKDGEAALTDREIRVLALRADGTKVDKAASDDWIAGALEMAIRHSTSGDVTVRNLADGVLDAEDVEDSDPMAPLWDARDRYLSGDKGKEA
jgi:hypothetical protein